MEECSPELIFLLGAARPFGFSGGGGAVFFPIDETRLS